MPVLTSHIQTESPEFRRNAEHHRELAEALRERQSEVAETRSERALALNAERGKMRVRDRIEALVDPDSPFLELSPLAAYGSTTTIRPARASSPASVGCRATSA